MTRLATPVQPAASVGSDVSEQTRTITIARQIVAAELATAKKDARSYYTRRGYNITSAKDYSKTHDSISCDFVATKDSCDNIVVLTIDWNENANRDQYVASELTVRNNGDVYEVCRRKRPLLEKVAWSAKIIGGLAATVGATITLFSYLPANDVVSWFHSAQQTNTQHGAPPSTQSTAPVIKPQASLVPTSSKPFAPTPAPDVAQPQPSHSNPQDFDTTLLSTLNAYLVTQLAPLIQQKSYRDLHLALNDSLDQPITHGSSDGTGSCTIHAGIDNGEDPLLFSNKFQASGTGATRQRSMTDACERAVKQMADELMRQSE